ncbi:MULTISPECIES: hypothetical protein [Brachybacterium]|uniref:Uncharacterized protein n=2 Tax=Brachybacterium TaxID=43668 RepID=A0A3R8QXS4_9MICO|nr:MULTISPECIES: hypothetical protein [Brachybacterium]RRR20281.1 hypothetical protein DS079_02465 [Brachybacterium paraconglomeratum]GLI32157.1 hypothetical protein BCONGLO52_29980 [Brachybacterium conglomeratum]GLK03691.1 hypothetical protein GCM10017597_04900 [Brachybacterium conglomeratum]
MNTVNTTENPQTRPEDEDREHLTGRTDATEDAVDATPDADLTDADASATSRARAEDETSVATTGADGTPAEADGTADGAGEAGSPRTALYVRRRRAPALGFWVLLSFLVPGVLALLSVPLFGFGDLRGVVNFVLLAMVVIGLPLAAIASFVDARRHRREDRRRG